MQSLLIGIDLPKKIQKEIYKLKKKVIKASDHQLQVDEPPHLTFVVNNFIDINPIDNVLEAISDSFSPFQINIEGISYFPQKKSGAWMIHATIQKNKILQKLQKNIVVETSRYRRGCLLCNYLRKNIPNYQCENKETKNIKKFGFPYVGDNWKPHISLTILDEEAFKKIGKELIKTNFKYIFKLEKIILYIYKNKWIPYKTYKLNKKKKK